MLGVAARTSLLMTLKEGPQALTWDRVSLKLYENLVKQVRKLIGAQVIARETEAPTEEKAYPGGVRGKACGRAGTRTLLSCLSDLEMLKDPCDWSSAGGTTVYISAWADPKPHDSGRDPVSLSKGWSVL